MASGFVNKDNYIRFIWGLLVVLYYIFIYKISTYILIDSDRANHVLQAYDILSGNILFNDWILTGVTFLTTDLIFYEIALLLVGNIDLKVIYITTSLMVSTVVIITYISAIYKRRDAWYWSLPIISILGIPAWSLFNPLRVHTAAVILGIGSILLICRYIDGDNKKRDLNWSAIFICLGVFGDKLTLLIASAPIITFAVRQYIFLGNIKYKIIIIYTALASFLAVLLEKMYFVLSDADRNSYLSDLHYVGFSFLSVKLTALFSDLMLMFNVDFWGKQLKDPLNICYLTNFLIFIMSLGAVCFVIKKYRENNCDALSVMLLMGILYCMLPYIFTEISQTRYITFIPLALCAILARNISEMMRNINHKYVCIFMVLLCVLSVGGRLCEVCDGVFEKNSSHIYERKDFESTLAKLQELGLDNGYATFWNASIYTVASNNNISVRHILINKANNRPHIYEWFCKREWYNQPSEFVLVNLRHDDISEEDVIKAFGQYEKRFECNNYVILVYDVDLSKKLDR